MFRVVILGQGEMLTNLIAGTLDAKCKIVGVLRNEVISKHPIERFFKDFLLPSEEYSYIKSYNLPEIIVSSANSEKFKKELIKLNPDIVLVGSWGEKFKKEIINFPKVAMINVHPSLLPKYRGPNPYIHVIKNKEKKSGVTFHLIDENYDSGAILMQKTVDIFPEDTGKELKQKTVIAARGAVCELLQNLNEDLIIPLVQTESKSNYNPQIKDNDVMLDFSKAAEDIIAHIKGFYPWHKTYFAHKDKFVAPNPYKLRILDNNTDYKTIGTIVKKSSTNQSITVVCGDGKLLEMSNVRLYKWYNAIFTAFYIKFCIKVADKIE